MFTHPPSIKSAEKPPYPVTELQVLGIYDTLAASTSNFKQTFLPVHHAKYHSVLCTVCSDLTQTSTATGMKVVYTCTLYQIRSLLVKGVNTQGR